MEHIGRERQSFASHWNNISPLMERAGYVPARSEALTCRTDMLRPKGIDAKASAEYAKIQRTEFGDLSDGEANTLILANLIDRLANHADVLGHTSEGDVMLAVDVSPELFAIIAEFDLNGDSDLEPDIEGDTGDNRELDWLDGPELEDYL